ncbi:MAG: nucleoside triphosphate pyrophosphohydrolase [Desulfobacula sp.]|nr:nucleoside triphosphate pyrophosphohydrolase [Desulfobacula sp.]
METIDTLFNIIQTLRSENGCAWDRIQTPETMWKCLAEELYELEEAIAKKDSLNTCEELGDVLFQLIFIMEIFHERGQFSFSDVVGQVAKKMIRRHPHVYEHASISTKKELDMQWNKIKAEEKKENGYKRESALDDVPKGMPSLLRALKVSKSAVKEGFEWDNIHGVLDTVKSEIKEFESALESGNQEDASMELGDVLFTLVNAARFADIHPETALAGATAKFEGRFRLMENELKKKDIKLASLSSEKKEVFWSRAKKSYGRCVTR